jgi:hypothetical protein
MPVLEVMRAAGADHRHDRADRGVPGGDGDRALPLHHAGEGNVRRPSVEAMIWPVSPLGRKSLGTEVQTSAGDQGQEEGKQHHSGCAMHQVSDLR